MAWLLKIRTPIAQQCASCIKGTVTDHPTNSQSDDPAPLRHFPISHNTHLLLTMMEFLVKSATVSILLFLIAMCNAEGEYQSNTYNRRAGTNMGLFPFPRIGRSDPSLASLYADLHEVKRQGLMPFPRVGRNDMRSHFGTQAVALPAWMLPDNLVEFQKRNAGNVNGGMWFGPRLGRLQKRSFEFADAPWALVALKEPSAGPKQVNYAPRSARESEEDNDDSVVEEVLTSRRLDSKSRNNNVAQ